MFRKHFLVAVLAGVVLLVATCDEPEVHSVSVKFIAPTDNQPVSPGVVQVRVQVAIKNGYVMSSALMVDGTQVDLITEPPETCDFTWDASNAVPGSKPILKAVAYWYYFNENVSPVNCQDSSMITVLVDSASHSGPTYHRGYVDTSEVWSPAGNPHIVNGDVVFHKGAWLTIEPGCVVKFDNPFILYFGIFGPSGLTAIGRADAQILFTSNQATPAPGDWNGVMFGDSTLAGTRLSYCTIEYGGVRGSEGAAISILNGGTVDEISNCTIRQSGMYGVSSMDKSSFGAFRDNVVTDNLGYALRLGPEVAEHLDASNVLTGNGSAGVELRGRLSTSATWPDIGAPYVIQLVSVGDSTNSPVLTIAPGTEVRFQLQGQLVLGQLGRNLPGRIVADGSAGRITFTSAAGTPAPGDFYGVVVYDGPSDESEFRNCDFSYGGRGDYDAGMLYVHGCGPVITGCDFGYSAKWGISFRTALVPDTVMLKQVNTFHDNGSGAIVWMRLFPSPGD